METLEKYKNVLTAVSIALLLINLVATCSNNSNIKSLTKQVKILDTAVVEVKKRPVPLTDEQMRDAVRDETMETMYRGLIYEKDLDDRKTSLSQIRSDVDRIKVVKP